MSPPSGAESVRTAIESGDIADAGRAVEDYLAWFRSTRRTPAEVAQCRDLLQWAAAAAIARRVRLAGELSRFTTVAAGYRPPRRSNTWHLDV